MSNAWLVENDSSVLLLLVVLFSEFNDFHTSDSWSGLSESFEIDGWVVKVSGQSRDNLILKKAIRKEMPNRVASLSYWFLAIKVLFLA